jgi:hypothetical protein
LDSSTCKSNGLEAQSFWAGFFLGFARYAAANTPKAILANVQQRAIFKLRPEQEESYFKEHPTDRAYAPAAQRMRTALFSALQRARA